MCKAAVVICYVSGILYTLASVFSSFAEDNGFFGHYQALYGFGPIAPYTDGGRRLNVFAQVANFFTLAVVLLSYGVVVAVCLYRRVFGKFSVS